MPEPKPYIPEEEKKAQRWLKISYWYATNKVLLRRILIGALIAFCVITLGYGLWGFFDYYVLSYAKEKRMFDELVSFRAYTREWIGAHAPRPLEVGKVYVFTAKDKYDFLVKIENSSPLYWAEFDYQFSYSGRESGTYMGFTLPGEEKWLAGLALASDSRPSNAKLDITDISWHRVDAKEVPDYESFVSEHLNINISDIEYLSEVSLDKGSFAKTLFTAKNSTAYNYWQVGFYIIAYRGATPSAVNYVVLDKFRSGESRDVEVSWFDSLSQVSKIEVVPEVNIFDETNYMPI